MSQQISHLRCTRKPLSRLLPLVLAALALGGIQAAHAMDPAGAAVSDADVLSLALAKGEVNRGVTREVVLEELRQARALKLLNPGGELGDTAEVLEARERYYAQQRSAVETHYAQLQEQSRLAALEAERRAQDVETAQRMPSQTAAPTVEAAVTAASTVQAPDVSMPADPQAVTSSDDASTATPASRSVMPADTLGDAPVQPGKDHGHDAAAQAMLQREGEVLMPDPVLETVYVKDDTKSDELSGYMEWSGDPQEAITVLLVEQEDTRAIDLD